MDFNRFVELFPNGKFIKLAKFDEKELTDEELRKSNKKPIDGRGIDHPLNSGEAKNWVTDGGRVGWIVPKNYICIDIDNKDNPKSAGTLERILYLKGVKFWSNQSKQGMHFFFKNTEEVMKDRSVFANNLTPLGIRADGRGNGKSYIILPVNDEVNRHWKDWEAESVDELPFYIRPLRPAHTDDPIFIDMPDGGGSDAMVRIRGIACKSNMITNEQSVEALRIINEIIWTSPMPEKMFNDTVAREMHYDNVKTADGTGPVKLNQWRILAQKLIAEQNLIARGSIIYKYADGQYKPFLPHELDKFILEKGNMDASASQRKETIQFICAFAQKPDNEFNVDWATIAVNNGMLDLNNQELLPHSPDNINTIKLKWNYNPDVEFSERIDNFMKMVSMGSQKKMNFLYEVAGYCLLKKNIFEKFFIFKGSGGTGKSTFCNLIKKMVGDEYISNVKLNQFDQDYYLATLTDKLVNIDYDASDKKTLEDSGRFKSIVCSEPVLVRQIYEVPITLTSCATIIINANHMPKIADKSDGLLRRMILVEIDHKIESPDPEFMSKITSLDIEYFFVKAVEGLQRVMKLGRFSIHESEAELKRRFQLGQSNLKKWLFERQININYLHGKRVADMFVEYKSFCIERNYGITTLQGFKEEIADETDMMVTFDVGQRDEIFERYDNDPRPDTYIFMPRPVESRRSPKWS